MKFTCGFDDVRRDADGYYCSVCGKRMPKDYKEIVEAEGYMRELRKIVERRK